MIPVGKTAIAPTAPADRLAVPTANYRQRRRGENQARQTDFISLLKFGKAAPLPDKDVHILRIVTGPETGYLVTGPEICS